MLSFLLLFASATLAREAAADLSYTDQGNRIVGGRYVSIREVPYQAQILLNNETICGATIISDCWLVSAAHCFAGSTEDEIFVITTGSSKSSSGQRHEIEQYVTHPNYSRFNPFDYDISLIKLKNRIQLKDNQQSIGLSSTPPKIGSLMRISGYGWESLRKTRRFLKATYVSVVDHTSCVERYKEIFTSVTSNMFCAGVRTSGSSCTADSGGPGVIDGELAGIVSGGYECNTEYYPGIYTRIYLFRSWVKLVSGV